MSDVVRFVRQLSHDLRNHLNAAELQSAFISEIATDPEVKDEVKRLRAMLSEMGGSLQTLTTSVAPVNLTTIRYEAAAFMEDLRQKLASKFPEESKMVEWTIDDAGNDSLDIDPQILQPAFLELFANAFQHERGSGSIRARTEVKDAGFVFTLDEPKTAFSAQTENWGREPFAKLKHGHYGLGLARVCSIIEAHQGQLRARYDSPSSSLVTQIVLPLSSGE
jgi:signal transduction histidine kinase